MRADILIAEATDFSGLAEARLREVGHVMLADLDRDGLLTAVGEVDVLWVRLRNRIDAEIMDAAPRLRMIASPTTGLTHIDLRAATDRGIEIISLRGETEFLRDVRATAEHTLGLILALLRQLPAAAQHVKEGGWDRDRFKGFEIYGKTVGIVGYGRLGRIVARYLHALGAAVLVADPYIKLAEVDSGARLIALDKLLASAEIVSLHVSHSESTHRFFDAKMFSRMRDGAWFINTARGELVDEQALVGALRSGHLRGAAVDVLDHELSTGMRDNVLVRYACESTNLLITPHIGGCTHESLPRAEEFLARKLASTLQPVIECTA